MKLFRLLPFCFLLVAVGCGPYFQVRDVDPKTGLYPTYKEVKKKDVLTYKIFPEINNINFLYLRSYTDLNGHDYEMFLRSILKEIGFKKIINQNELSQIVIHTKLSDKIPSISDLVALNRLSREIGPFLIADAVLDNTYGSWFKFDFVITDPVSGTQMLGVSYEEVCEFNLDKEVNYPVINIIKQWYTESAIQDDGKRTTPTKHNSL